MSPRTEAAPQPPAPIVRVTNPVVHVPYSPAMEKPLYPDKEKIVVAVRRLLYC